MSDASMLAQGTDGSTPGGDRVQKALIYAILFVVVVALSGLMYMLLGGFLTGNTPRTLAESKLLTLKDAAVSNPGSGAARRDYILALLDTGQNGAAASEYKRALKDMSGIEKTAVYDAGVSIRFYTKDYKGALELAKTAIAADDAVRNKQVADAKARGAAVSFYDSFPNTYRISILITSARASGALKKWDDAEKSLTDALKFDPMAADVLILRADVYEKMGKRDKAVADYKQALTYIPDSKAAIDGLKRLNAK